MLKRAILIAFFTASSTFAQNIRSAVSVSGLDTNPCSVSLPCRSFAAAIAATFESGEVIALDSAGYGAFVIDREMTVDGAPGVHAAISVPLNAGIDVVAQTTDHVVIRNIVLGGQSLSSALADGSLIWLSIHSAIYLCAGWLLFKWCERIAKQQGSLSHY